MQQVDLHVEPSRGVQRSLNRTCKEARGREIPGLKRLPSDPEDDGDEERMRAHKYVMVEGEASSRVCRVQESLEATSKKTLA